MSSVIVYKGLIKHVPSGLYVIPVNGKGCSNALLILAELNDNDKPFMFECDSTGYIKHVQSGLFIHPAGGQKNPANGTKLLLHPNKHFRMTFSVLDNGNIIHCSSEKYWGIAGNAFKNGSNVVISDDNKFCNFKFVALDVDDDDSWDNITSTGINNNNNNNNNDIKDDNIPDELERNDAELNDDAEGKNDIHDVSVCPVDNKTTEAVDVPSPGTRKVIPEGAYFVFAQHSGLCMDVLYSKKENSTPVIQYKLNGGNCQRFYFHYDKVNDCYEVECLHSGKYWDIQGASKNKGATLIQFQKNNGLNQKFILTKLDDGLFRIKILHSDLCLDISGASDKPMTKVIQWKYHGGSNQKFRLLPCNIE